MKHLITFALFLASIPATAQELVRNEVDEFTGARVKETSWEKMLPWNGKLVHFKVRAVNDKYLLDLKWIGGGIGVTSISEGASLMLKLDDGKVITMTSTATNISCPGCGSINLLGSKEMGISATYAIAKDQVLLLKDHEVLKLRLYTTDGYQDEELKKKHSDAIRDAFALVYE